MNSQVIFSIIYLLIALVLYYWFQKRKSSRPNPVARPIDDSFRFRASPELADECRKRVFSDQDPNRVQALFDRFSFRFAPDGSFVINPQPDVVASVVRKSFTLEDQDKVIAVLNRFGSAKHEPEQGRGRIYIDIIKAAGGDCEKVEQLVKQAKNDFRDLVIISENPNLSLGIRQKNPAFFDPSTNEYREAVDKDLRQFGLWLLQYI